MPEKETPDQPYHQVESKGGPPHRYRKVITCGRQSQPTVPLLLIILAVSLIWPDPAPAKRKKREPAYSPVSLAPFVGYWEGPGAVDLGRQRGRAQVALSITEEIVLFDVTYGRANTRARLKPLGLRDGVVHLEVDQAESQGLGIDLGRITMSFQERPSRPVSIRLETPPPEPPSSQMRRRSRRSSPPPPPPRPERKLEFLSGTLLQAQELSTSERLYGDSSYFHYADWRTLSEDFENTDPRREEADQKLAADIQRLQNDGWKCLSQIHRSIPPKGRLDLTLESSPGTPRLHLIYSRLPGPRIVYRAGKQPPGYLGLYPARNRSYPTVVSENGWTTQLTLTTQPAPGSLERIPRSIPVTVFIFGNTVGDYGEGCRLEEFGLEPTRQFNEYMEVLGGLALVAGMESLRRESVKSEAGLLQALATIGRNEAIEATLRRLFPSASTEAIGYYGRWAQLLVSADVSAISLFRDTARESILQQIQRDNPEIHLESQMVDLLVDLHLQREALRRTR